jgi:hypothetical protein
MANTYTLIEAQTLASSAASVTFSSIPATYTDLVLRVSARTSTAGISDVSPFVTNVGGTAYSYIYLMGNGSTATSALSATRADFAGYSVGDTATASTFSNVEIYIPSYTAAQNKPVSVFAVNETNAATAGMRVYAELLSSTTAISSITLTGQSSSNYLTGSSFYLYGIKNS